MAPPSGPSISEPTDALSKSPLIQIQMATFGLETQTPLVTSQPPVQAMEVSSVDCC